MDDGSSDSMIKNPLTTYFIELLQLEEFQFSIVFCTYIIIYFILITSV